MEIVAMDMKVSGMYIARQLSFSGVTFRIEEIPLDQQYKLVYNKAAQLVSQVPTIPQLSPEGRDNSCDIPTVLISVTQMGY